MAWAEVDAELGAHFLTKELGVGADDHWGVMAGFSIDELNELLSTMKFKGESLRLGVKAKLRNVFKAGRYLSGVADDIPQPVTAPPQQMLTPIINVEFPGVAGKIPPGYIALTDTVSQTDTAIVKLLDDGELDKLRHGFFKTHGNFPKEDEEVTIEQLSSLDAVLKKYSFYVDFALWVPFWQRMIKTKRFMGQALDDKGVLQTVEILGPPDVP